ncbi:MAG: hypothetical protein KC420_05275 [Myxococcales bacterium]|nr:hypothetical protein [Myxococcales bacterium]MCB9569678.1 hypothetical protein [Myxococcales bacterium]
MTRSPRRGPKAPLLLVLAGLSPAVAAASVPATDGRAPAAEVPVEPQAAPDTAATSAPPAATPEIQANKSEAGEPAAVAAPSPAPSATASAEATPTEEPRGMEVTPRQLILSTGWSWLAVDDLPDALVAEPRPHPHGVALFTGYLWQVGGLGRRWPSWIGFHLGLDAFPATALSRRDLVLSYGLLVKHGLGRHHRVRPFLSYGLGAAQAWVKTIDGRGVSHQTRLSAGVDVRVGPERKTAISFEVAYKIQILPTFRWGGADILKYNFHILTVGVGATFDLAARGPRRRRAKGERRREQAG